MFSDPQRILDQVSIPQGATVCDIGAGSGHYAMQLSSMVGDAGKVYAIDIQKELLSRLSTEARVKHRYNIEVIWGDAEKLGGTKLRSTFSDLVLICNVFFQVEKKDDFLKEVNRILKSGGRVLFVEWTGSFNGMGPHADHVVTKEKAKTLFEAHGFIEAGEIDAGTHHYGMIFKKN